MSKTPTIGFIGVGPMGHGMAANIVKAGYPLVIKGNRNRAPVESLAALGAREVGSAAEMAADCDVIHLCLSNSPQVEAIIRGPGGILEGGKPGLVVIDCTTADPTSTLALAADLEAAGMHMVDAPLGRTPKEAEAGQLDAMIGAAPEIFARVKPIIDCWAGNINHIGPVGAGHKMKLIMNFIGMGYAALYGEAVVMAAKSGLSPQAVRQVIGSSRLSNGFFETFMKYTVDRDPNAHIFSIENAAKDVGYAANMAAAADVVNIMGASLKHYYTHAIATGHGTDYVPMLGDIIGALNGVDMAAEVEKGQS